LFHDRSKYIEFKRYILRNEVQKREVVLQYISTDEKIVDILVKPLSKVEKVCVLKKQAGARGDDFLIEKERNYSQVGREH
jgi:CRISPR/Cas system Type II protein with McrA/HNH and RuvC-like nuclease domain